MIIRAPKGWAIAHLTPGVVHIYPPEDTFEHELSEDCLCGPGLEIVQFEPDEQYFEKTMSGQDATDHRDGHVYTHHALDGRE